MKYALVILVDPQGERAHNLALQNIAKGVRQAAKDKPIAEVLNEGAFLFPLEHGLSGLNQLLSDLSQRGVQSRTLFFPEMPSWVVTSP